MGVLFLFLILVSCLRILLFINSELFISGLIEFGSLDLTDLPENLSAGLPVPSLDVVVFIANVSSFKCCFVILTADFFNPFFTESTPLSARLLLCGWYALLGLCLML